MFRKNIYRITLFLILFLYATVCFSAEEPLNLSIRDGDVRDVLQGISLQYGINIIPDASVTGNVTINLQNAPFESGLKLLLEANGYEYEKKDNVYYVKRKFSPTSFEVIFQNNKLSIHADSVDIKQLILEISKKTQLSIVSEAGMSGNVNVNVSDVPIDDALFLILEPIGFEVTENNGIYSVKAGKQALGPQKSFSISYRKERLYIDAKNAPASDVLSEIASKCKINLAITEDVRGNISVRLDDVTLEQAINIITDTTGSAYIVADNIYMVGNPQVKPGMTNPVLESKIIWLKHINAQDIINAIPADIPKTNVTVSMDRNALIVLGSKKTIERIESLLKEIDVDNPEIRSKQQNAVFVEVDEAGLLTIDTKEAAIEDLLREISIKKGIDITILRSYGESASLSPKASRKGQGARVEQTQQAPAQQAQVNQRASMYQPNESLGGNVNFRISKATLEETFDGLFKGTGYVYKKEIIGSKELYIVGTGDLVSGGGNPLAVSKKIELKYLKASDIIEILPVTVSDSNIVVLEDQNAIMVMGTQIMIDELESYIAQIDTPAPQIMIEALLVEVVRGDSRTLGLNWSWANGNGRNKVQLANGLLATFDSFASVPDRFLASLDAMISENKARILSAPRVATTSGMKASIKVGWTDYFETSTQIYTNSPLGSQTGNQPSSGGYIPPGSYLQQGFNSLESGITLDITPWVGSAGEITVLIHPEIKDAKEISKEHSTIAERTMETNVRVKDGENIVIGGLIQKSENSDESRIPWLGSIPILGHLFKKSKDTSSNTELIIIVRPKLIGNDKKEASDEASK